MKDNAHIHLHILRVYIENIYMVFADCTGNSQITKDLCFELPPLSSPESVYANFSL